MENLKKKLGEADDFILGRNKTNYFILIPTQSKKIPLSDDESRSLMDYYIGASYRLREKTNESSIGQTLRALFSRQMYSGIVEFDDSDTIYRGLVGLESFDGSSDISESEKSFDTKSSAFQFQLVQNPYLEEALQACDKIILQLLNSALPGSQGCTSFSGFKNQGISGDILLTEQDYEGEEEKQRCDEFENTNKQDRPKDKYSMVYEFHSSEQYSPPFRVKLFSPSKIEKMIKAPIKVSTNMMRIYESGFGNHRGNFSVFQDIAKSLEILNVELEVRNLQINCKFIFAKNRSKANSTYNAAFKEYVEKREMDLKWIHTMQILEVYLYFENLKTQHDLESFIQTQNPPLPSLASYGLKVTIHHPLTAAIINDTKIQLLSHSKPHYIKTLYFSSEVKSNMFKYLNENNNIAFIHTRSFIDSRDIKYKRFVIDKNLVAQVANSDNIISDSGYSDSLTSSEQSSQNLSQESFDINSYDDSEDIFVNPPNLPKKSNKSPEISIFDVYREFLTASYARSFIFTSYDVSSKQISKISRSLHFPLNLEALVHSKTHLLLFLIAYNHSIAPHLYHNPTHSAWDLFL